MSKLITAFLANPTFKNRDRLVAYLTKHPMAVCLATSEEHAVIKSLFNGAKAP
jgi:hypothetical protein